MAGTRGCGRQSCARCPGVSCHDGSPWVLFLEKPSSCIDPSTGYKTDQIPAYSSHMIDLDDFEILANYESLQLIKAQFQRHHGLELNTGKAREIATAFTQAKGYLESARTAARIVRPLLVYYAVLSFSRGLTLFLTAGIREAGLAQSHGLSVDGWGEELSREAGEVASLKIKLNAHGTLAQLIEATNHESYLRNNSSSPNHIAKMDRPAAGTEIRLGDLFSRFPEIRSTFIRWQKDRCAVALWPQKQTPDGGMEVR
jgi:hypothetical protein